MARYREAKCKLCRREGGKLFLKGDKCYMDKCPFNKRPVAPGQHGADRKKVSEYGLQLREKQKTKRIYGVQEGQFRKYYEMADRMKGVTGENMLSLLERRLDNVVFRMGLAPSRTLARQIVSHAHLSVNGKTVTIPSYIVKWVEFDREKLEGKVLALPTREDIDSQIAEHMIVELYSK